MTHEELLAKIEDDEVYEYFRAYPSLRAVIELHKPHGITLPNGREVAYCVSCDAFYPCHTIDAIEKELK